MDAGSGQNEYEIKEDEEEDEEEQWWWVVWSRKGI